MVLEEFAYRILPPLISTKIEEQCDEAMILTYTNTLYNQQMQTSKGL